MTQKKDKVEARVAFLHAPDATCYNRRSMRDAKTLLNEQYLEMRWRALSLAADFDRIQRAAGGADVLGGDLRIANLRKIAELLKSDAPNRAELVQMLLSDQTPSK